MPRRYNNSSGNLNQNEEQSERVMDPELKQMRKRQKKDKAAMDRKHHAKRMEETSSFRCAASYQKFRNFSMSFILSGIAGLYCVAFMVFAICFHIILAVIGLVYLDDCPLEPMLPVWCGVAGFAFAFKMFTAMMFLAVVRKDVRLTGGVPEKTTIYKSPRYFCLCGIVDICLGVLLILGMTLTLPIADCMFGRMKNETDSTNCPSTDSCNSLAFVVSLISMIFLTLVYVFAYLAGLWAAGCVYPKRQAEEPAGKTCKAFSKVKRPAWVLRKKKNKK